MCLRSALTERRKDILITGANSGLRGGNGAPLRFAGLRRGAMRATLGRHLRGEASAEQRIELMQRVPPMLRKYREKILAALAGRLRWSFPRPRRSAGNPRHVRAHEVQYRPCAQLDEVAAARSEFYHARQHQGLYPPPAQGRDR